MPFFSRPLSSIASGASAVSQKSDAGADQKPEEQKGQSNVPLVDHETKTASDSAEQKEAVVVGMLAETKSLFEKKDSDNKYQ